MRALALRAFFSSSEAAGAAGAELPGTDWPLGDAGCGAAWAAMVRGSPPTWDQADRTKTRIGRNCFIPLEEVIACNQNCSVSCGLSARSRESSFLPWMPEMAGMQARTGVLLKEGMAIFRCDCFRQVVARGRFFCSSIRWCSSGASPGEAVGNGVVEISSRRPSRILHRKDLGATHKSSGLPARDRAGGTPSPLTRL